MSGTNAPIREYAPDLGDGPDETYHYIESGTGAYNKDDPNSFCLSGFISAKQAARIVRACNSHDALVDACKQAFLLPRP